MIILDQDMVPKSPDQMEEANGRQTETGSSSRTSATSAKHDGGRLHAAAAPVAHCLSNFFSGDLHGLSGSSINT